MGGVFSSIAIAAIGWLVSQSMTGTLWDNKKPDGSDKSPWPVSPKGLPYFYNGYKDIDTHQYHAFTEWAKQLGSLFSVKIGGRRVIVLNEGTLVQEVFVNQDQKNSAHVVRDTVEMIMTDNGKTVFSSAFDMYWSRLRRAIVIVIGTSYAEQFDTLFSSQANKLTNGIDLETKEKESKITLNTDQLRNMVEMIALDTSLAMVVGEKHADPSLLLTVTQLCKEAENVQSNTWIHYGRFFNFIKSIYSGINLLRSKTPGIQQRDALFNIFLEWLQTALEPKDTPTQKCPTHLLESLVNIRPSKNDLEPVQLANEEVLVNIVHLTLHSYACLASALFTMIQRLSVMPELQAQIHEQLTTAPDTAATVDDWPLVKAFVDESMRYEPPMRMYSHSSRVSDDISIKGVNYRVDMDTELVANLDRIHFDERYYPDPHTFDPKRFLPSEKETVSLLNPPTRKPRAARDHLAFGAGRRVCQGAKVSERMLAAVVARLVRTYTLEGGNPHAKVDYSSNLWSWTGRTETQGEAVTFVKR
ncbi:cytochrome P450 [Spinellus fusiger]|nr:cytochrome P450 [Spinellus fusiger]